MLPGTPAGKRRHRERRRAVTALTTRVNPKQDRDGTSWTYYRQSQNDWSALRFDGGGEIGDAALGPSRTLDRQEQSRVAPEKSEPCLTAEQHFAR
jgi:hypothetical protein